jgi:CDP-6-deoxy-D-xylo-4-hexulose-3-dehydrase
LRDGLDELKAKLILPVAADKADPSWFGFLLTVRAGAGFERAALVNYLENQGIQTRMLFAGNMIKHPCFDEMRVKGEGYRVVGELKNTDLIMNNTFWVGVYPGLTPEMIDFMIKTIKDFVKGGKSAYGKR